MELQKGTLFGERYSLVQEKGRGSFGEVWLAKDTRLDIDVALKIYIALDDRGVEEFKAEFKNAYNLNHPNLLHATYFDTDGHRPYLVMPYCPSSATELIGKCDEKLLWKFIADVCAGLSYLHKMDVVHHDIKPDNILRNDVGNFVITDFGISTNMRSTFRRNSQRGSVTDSLGGALPYMGPEMFSGEPESIKATDIWALGATLFELATGELPFFGQGGIMLTRGAEIPVVKGDYSEDLKNVIRDCLALQTWDRPQAAALYGYALAKTMGSDAKPTWRREDPAPTKLMLGNDKDPAANDEALLRRTQAMDSTISISSAPQAPSVGPVPSVGPLPSVGPDSPVTKARPSAPARAVKKPAVPADGKMNPVVIAWLCLGILGSMFLLFLSLRDLLDMYPGDNKFFLAMPGIAGILEAIGFIMMLRKSKAGFLLASITPVMYFAGMFAYSSGDILYVPQTIVFFLIFAAFIVATFCITLIRKNGISAWKLMTFKKLGGWQQWAVGTLIIVGLFLIPNTRQKRADSTFEAYDTLCTDAKANIASSQPRVLIDALEQLQQIKAYEDEFWYDDRYDNYESLIKKYKPHAAAVAKEWRDAGQAMKRAGNTVQANEYEGYAKELDKAKDL